MENVDKRPKYVVFRKGEMSLNSVTEEDLHTLFFVKNREGREWRLDEFISTHLKLKNWAIKEFSKLRFPEQIRDIEHREQRNLGTQEIVDLRRESIEGENVPPQNLSEYPARFG